MKVTGHKNSKKVEAVLRQVYDPEKAYSKKTNYIPYYGINWDCAIIRAFILQPDWKDCS